MKRILIILLSFLLFSESVIAQVTKIANVEQLRKRKGSANAIAELQGYYTANDGGGQQVVWNATSTKTDNGGTVFQVSGVSVGRWESLSVVGNKINVKIFGVKGDFVNDEILKIQKATDFCASNGLTLYFPNGNYKVKNNYFIYGKVSIEGENNVLTNIVLDSLIANNYWVCIGMPAYSSAPSTWTGSITNIGFKINYRIDTGINFFQAKDCKINNCVFTSNGNTYNKVIGGINNGSYTNPTLVYPRDNVELSNNILYVNSNEGESIGFAAKSRKIKIHNNQILGGCGDDLGFHNVDDSYIKDNYIEAYDARIYISNSRQILISNNQIIYVNGSTSGMGILVEVESINTPIVSQNIIIENNTITYNATHPVGNYGIRIKSGRNITIQKNRLINLSTAVISGSIMIEDQVLTGFVDPTGLDPENNAYSRNISINDNFVDGSIGINGGSNGKLTVSNNIANNYYSVQSVNFLNNTYTTADRSLNLITPSKFFKNSQYPVFSGIGLTGSSFQKLKIGSAGYEYVFRKNVRILSLDVSLTSQLTSGFYQINIYKNGVLCGTTRTYSVYNVNSGNTIVSTTASDINYDFQIGDKVHFEVKLNNGVPISNDISININSIEFN